ncbi:MAG: cell division protein FtsQ/DivIB [bacterium]
MFGKATKPYASAPWSPEPRPPGAPRRRRLLFILSLVALALLVPGAIVGGRALRRACETSPRFAIRDILVDGTRRLDPATLATEAGVLSGENLFRLTPELAEARLSTNPWIATADIRRHFPSRVEIHVTEREPVALVSNGEWCGVDATGAVLPLDAIDERFDLPILTGCGAVTALDAERLRRGAAFLELVGRERAYLLRDISEVDLSDPVDLVAYTLHSGTAVRFGAEGWGEKLARLVPVLEDLSGVERMPVTIDLRFAGQAVVRFQEQPEPKESEDEA